MKGTIEYTVEYSDRKTMQVVVKSAKVIVKAPRGTTKRKTDKLIADNLEKIKAAVEKQMLRKDRFYISSPEELAEMKRSAKEYFRRKTAEYAEIMGLKYNRITITAAKTRHGSCSYSRRAINYSYFMMRYPEELRDYVIVHELSHLMHPNHSRAFYDYLKIYMPDYEERKERLRTYFD